jgi:pimeloyl-[acyl-carrier protein] methyl ester esterase
MNLHVKVSGQGRPLVLLHGWGMHGGVWGVAAESLAQSFEVHAVDLPGHGYSGKRETGDGKSVLSPLSLDAVVSELSDRFPHPVNVLGWSLGGLIAQHWAMRAPETVQRLVLVSSTPCFAARDDWECGMPQQTLAQFAAELEKDYTATLRRFLALQLRGSENERELLALLRERLFSRGEPDMQALRGGLDILRDADLRAALPEICRPVLAIAGARDKLTPPQASEYMAQAMPHARAVVIEGAAHAPFLSHPQSFMQAVRDFLDE